MTKEEYVATKRKLKQDITDILNEANNKVEPIKEDLKALEDAYVKILLAQNPHIQIGNQFRYGKDLVWITDILLDSYSIDLKVKLNKVKKDGTNGNAVANRYGAAITSLKEII